MVSVEELKGERPEKRVPQEPWSPNTTYWGAFVLGLIAAVAGESVIRHLGIWLSAGLGLVFVFFVGFITRWAVARLHEGDYDEKERRLALHEGAGFFGVFAGLLVGGLTVALLA